MYWTLRNINNYIIHGVYETPNMPDIEDRKLQASVDLGGTVNDWEFIELNLTNFLKIRNALPARSKLVNGEIINALPILTTLSKTTINSDGLDTTTLNIDLQDTNYNGNVNIKIKTPIGDIISTDLLCNAGKAEDTITTSIEGVHYITIETVLHGLQFTLFEGI